MRVNLTRSPGYFSFNLTVAGIAPVSISAPIFSSSVLPIPGTSVSRPSSESCSIESGDSRTARAASR